MDWADLMREGAQALVFKHPARLENVILKEMRKLSDQNLIPDWKNYSQSKHWKIVQGYLNKEELFMYRCCYIKLFKATWPKPVP